MNPGISISPKKIFRVLMVCIAGLVLASTLSETARHTVGVTPANRDYLMALSRLFYVDSEKSLATLFSILQLGVAAILLGLITVRNTEVRGKRSGRWTLLTLIFVGLTIDEACSIHEMTIRGMGGLRAYLTSGYFHYTWVVLGIGFVTAFTAYYVPFLRHLPRKTARDFIIAGAIFVVGAVGMEMLGAKHDKMFGRDNLGFVTYSTIEETLEMTGIAIFVKALLQYLQLNHRLLPFEVAETTTQPPTPALESAGTLKPSATFTQRS